MVGVIVRCPAQGSGPSEPLQGQGDAGEEGEGGCETEEWPFCARGLSGTRIFTRV